MGLSKELMVSLLPVIHRECPHILHWSVVLELHSRREEVSPESREHRSEDHRMPPGRPTPLPGDTIQLAVSQKGEQHPKGPHPPRPRTLPTATLGQTIQTASRINKQTEGQFLSPSAERAQRGR